MRLKKYEVNALAYKIQDDLIDQYKFKLDDSIISKIQSFLELNIALNQHKTLSFFNCDEEVVYRLAKQFVEELNIITGLTISKHNNDKFILDLYGKKYEIHYTAHLLKPIPSYKNILNMIIMSQINMKTIDEIINSIKNEIEVNSNNLKS